MTRFALLCAFALCSVARGADLRGQARILVGTGVDSNVRRELNPAVPPVTDGMGTVIAEGSGSAAFEKATLFGSYEGGLRKFLQSRTDDLVIQAAAAEGRYFVLPKVAFGAGGRGRDRRGGQRGYTDLNGFAFIDFVPDAQVDLRARLGARRFNYHPLQRYNFGASEAGVSGRYRFNRRHSVLVFGELGTRRFQAEAFQPAKHPDLSRPRRSDSVLAAGAGYTFRGSFAFSATYSYFEQLSNSFGETNLHHRLLLSGGFRLPARLMLLTRVAIQLNRFPDGVYLSPDNNLLEDDENQNSLSVRLVRPLSRAFDLEMHYAVYTFRFAQNELDYLRQLGWLGLTWRIR